MKKIAIVLSGCGHPDGAEVTESVSLLITFDSLGAKTQIFAPSEVLSEVQKIARGSAQALTDLKEQDYDALVFAGGGGVATKLCNWQNNGARSIVLPDVKRVIEDFYKANKPMGGVCIAPILFALTLGTKRVTLTLGSDPATIVELEKTGALHEICSVDDFISDRDHKIVTSPAYMIEDAKPHKIFLGISKLCREIFEMS